MAVLETKYVTAGLFYYVNYGYISAFSVGSVSDTSGGSSNTSLTDLYSNSVLIQLTYNSQQDTLNLYINDISSNVTNGVWDFMKIGSTSFNRTDATYTQNASGNSDSWVWTSISTNPLPNGSTNQLTFETTTTTDGTPNQFGFSDRSGVAVNTEQNAYAEITGINTTITVSRASGTATFAVSSSSATPASSNFNASNKTLTTGQYIHVKQTSSSSVSTTLTSSITAGGVTGTWNVSTAGAAGTGNFGMEVFTAAGTKVIYTSTRGTRFLGSGTTSNITSGGSQTISFSGIDTSDKFQVFVTPNNPPSGNQDNWSITKSTNQFVIANNLGQTSSFDYIVMRSG